MTPTLAELCSPVLRVAMVKGEGRIICIRQCNGSLKKTYYVPTAAKVFKLQLPKFERYQSLNCRSLNGQCQILVFGTIAIAINCQSCQSCQSSNFVTARSNFGTCCLNDGQCQRLQRILRSQEKGSNLYLT